LVLKEHILHWLVEKLKIKALNISLGLIFIISLITFAATSIGQNQVADNLTIFSNLISNAILKIANELDFESDCKIFLKDLKAKNDTEWLFQKELFQILNQKGISQYYLFPADEEYNFDENLCNIVIILRPIKLSVDYRSKLNAKESDVITRHIKVDFFSQVQKKDTVIYSNTFQERFFDEISKKVIPTLENKNYKFTCGPPTPANFLNKFFEPLITIAVTGIIIYMFYSFRSK